MVMEAPGRPRAMPGPAVERLLEELVRYRVAGLVLVTDRHDARLIPAALRITAGRSGLPLLTSTASLAEWDRLALRVRARNAEWQARQLNALLERLPARLTDPEARQRIADWLAATVDAEVLVSDSRRGVLAASPPTAPATLAPALAACAVQQGGVEESGSRTRLVRLPGAGTAVLALRYRRAPDDAADGLVEHATKVLGLVDQAIERYQRVSMAEHGVRLGAFQLLLVGELVPAQRVLAGLAPWLLNAERMRVFVVDCGGHDREVTAERCEAVLADSAMMVRCPAFNHLIVLTTADDESVNGSDGGPQSVRDVLRSVVAGLPGHRMGGSRAHPLDAFPEAYMEAFDALTTAREAPDRVALARPRNGLVDVLPIEPARRWAGTFLRPLLALPVVQRDQLLRTVDLGLEFHHKAAANILGVHRNTVRHRNDRAFELLGLDRNHVLHQVVVSTALKIVFAYGHEDGEGDPAADFEAMVSTERVRAWAESFLRPLRDDRRGLLRTLTEWLDRDTHAESAAKALGISPITVRNHVRAAVPLLQRELVADLDEDVTPDDDEHVLGGVRPLAFALHISTGHPRLSAAAAGTVHAR
jgi:sugar diacid utilization regulator